MANYTIKFRDMSPECFTFGASCATDALRKASAEKLGHAVVFDDLGEEICLDELVRRAEAEASL